jgi:class 3 adenylate cyclase
MDLRSWLRSLGLEKYEVVLRDNEIDDAVLHSLTEDHLRELGFPLGARLKLLNAIAALDATATTAATPAGSTTAAAPTPEAIGERRQVTVMFSDLVGSTALSARMDPEDLREVISAYQKRVAETVQRFGGFVAKYMGDGVLVYFGYPQAHEDDAERAVRAGLDIAAVVAKLETRANENLKVRIGIATGIVVVGDLVGQGSAQEQAVVGETPNLAARLQTLAEPGSLVIAEATRRLLGGTFELKGTGVAGLKRFWGGGPRVGGAARGGERQPLRGSTLGGHDALRQARARDRAAHRPLARRGERRGPGHIALGRSSASPRMLTSGPNEKLVAIAATMMAMRAGLRPNAR